MSKEHSVSSSLSFGDHDDTIILPDSPQSGQQNFLVCQPTASSPGNGCDHVAPKNECAVVLGEGLTEFDSVNHSVPASDHEVVVSFVFHGTANLIMDDFY